MLQFAWFTHYTICDILLANNFIFVRKMEKKKSLAVIFCTSIEIFTNIDENIVSNIKTEL